MLSFDLPAGSNAPDGLTQAYDTVMGDFAHSTLWRISAFERMRAGGSLADAGPTLLPTTLLTDLRRLQADPVSNDVLEVVAACLRHQEPALLYLALAPLVWPVTVFPAQRLYHAPRGLADMTPASDLPGLRLISAEPPGVRPPGHFRHDRVAAPEKYRPLAPLLCALALNGPRSALLAEIGGRTAYRLAAGAAETLPPLPGALAPAALRLREKAASLREMARWPGMSTERASRLLNALYLSGNLMVMRSHAAARDEPAGPAAWRQWLGRRR